MATSGTVTHQLELHEALIEAYERAGVPASKLTGYDMLSGLRSVNLLFSDWSTRGVNFWKVDLQTFTTTQGTENYTLAAGTVDVLVMSIRRSGSDVQLSRMSLTDYEVQPDKSSQGKPTSYFLDRQYTPEVYLWQNPENSTDVIRYWRVAQTDDASALAQDPDIPYRWQEAFCAGLAAKLCVKKDISRLTDLSALATVAFDNAADDERERATLKIVPPSVVA